MFDWLNARRFSRRLRSRTDSVPTLKLKACPSTTSCGTSIASNEKTDNHPSPFSSQQGIRPPLLQLPLDLLYEIVSHLDPLARVALRRTCSVFRDALSQRPSLTRNCIVLHGDDFVKSPDLAKNIRHVRHLQICEPAVNSQVAPLVMNNFGCIMDPTFDNLVSLDMCLSLNHNPGEPQNKWSGMGLRACLNIEHLTLRMTHVRSNSQKNFCSRLFDMSHFYFSREFPELRSFILIDATPNAPKRYLGKYEFRALIQFLACSTPKLTTLELPSTWRVDLRCYWLIRWNMFNRRVPLHSLSAHPSLAMALCRCLLNVLDLHILSLQASQLGKYSDIRRPLFTPYRFPRAHAVRTLRLAIAKHGREQYRINWGDIVGKFPDLEQIYISTPYKEHMLIEPRMREVFQKLPKLTSVISYSSFRETEPTQHAFCATRDTAGNVIELRQNSSTSPYTQALQCSWYDSCSCELVAKPTIV